MVGKNGGGSRRNSQCDDVIERDVSIVCVDVSGESGIVYLGSEANHAKDSEASVVCGKMIVQSCSRSDDTKQTLTALVLEVVSLLPHERNAKICLTTTTITTNNITCLLHAIVHA